MTTFILSQKKILSLGTRPLINKIRGQFKFGVSKWLSLISISAIIFTITLYLVALYASFILGGELQKQNSRLVQIKEEVSSAESIFQKKILSLAEHSPFLLESMEEIAVIKYLIPENLAISKPAPHP